MITTAKPFATRTLWFYLALSEGILLLSFFSLCVCLTPSLFVFSTKSSSPSSSAFALASSSSSPDAEDENRLEGVPPPFTRAEIGRMTWSLLHTITAQQDDSLSASTRDDLAQFLTLMGQFFPCAECRRHFSKTLQRSPPSKLGPHAADFQQWICRAHNIVNKFKDKPRFDPFASGLLSLSHFFPVSSFNCSTEALMQVWPKQLRGAPCACSDDDAIRS